MIRQMKLKRLIPWLPAFLPAILHAQEAGGGAATGDSSMAVDGEFWILITVSALLLYVIYALSETIRWAADKKLQEQKKEEHRMPKILILIPFLLCMLPHDSLMAQSIAGAPPAQQQWFFQDQYFPLYLLIGIELLVITYLCMMLFSFVRRERPARAVTVKHAKSWLVRVWEKMNYRVPIEREEDILLEDHEYDGIRELDNSMPPWLQYIFFATVLFAICYFIYYFFGFGPTQQEEYVKSMQKAELQLAEYRSHAADQYDENTVVLDQSPAVIEAGKAIFTQNCIACHGANAQGDIGPNLTDDYWLHGGRINDVFHTIKYGVQDKGMASWKDILSSRQIFQVANYVKSLHGSNPPNAKEPQGDLYTETPQTDSTATPGNDTLKMVMQ